MSFTCISVQTEPNKSPLRKRLLAILLRGIGCPSSPNRSCLGRLILIRGGRGVGFCGWGPPHPMGYTCGSDRALVSRSLQPGPKERLLPCHWSGMADASTPAPTWWMAVVSGGLCVFICETERTPSATKGNTRQSLSAASAR